MLDSLSEILSAHSFWLLISTIFPKYLVICGFMLEISCAFLIHLIEDVFSILNDKKKKNR